MRCSGRRTSSSGHRFPGASERPRSSQRRPAPARASACSARTPDVPMTWVRAGLTVVEPWPAQAPLPGGTTLLLLRAVSGDGRRVFRRHARKARSRGRSGAWRDRPEPVPRLDRRVAPDRGRVRRGSRSRGRGLRPRTLSRLQSTARPRRSWRCSFRKYPYPLVCEEAASVGGRRADGQQRCEHGCGAGEPAPRDRPLREQARHAAPGRGSRGGRDHEGPPAQAAGRVAAAFRRSFRADPAAVGSAGGRSAATRP